jgi:hypothetical protein
LISINLHTLSLDNIVIQRRRGRSSRVVYLCINFILYISLNVLLWMISILIFIFIYILTSLANLKIYLGKFYFI